MPYITREDGERFVIPSYRDVLSAKNKSLLKKDILMLSQNYGEYITLQRKGPATYEVAFSPDAGYLLGESIWHQFKRPPDMIYCEAIPNTTEAILVIVKSGSVYLDGSFPLDSIPEELVIFLTQKNNFEIYIYGDVPISKTPESGKFSFEASSVKSFTVLEKPIFPTLPLLKMYQLQLVDQVLRAHGIGVFPTRQIVVAIILIALTWYLYSYFTSKKVVKELISPPPPNPYASFNNALMSSYPEMVMERFLTDVRILMAMPGWQPTKIIYEKGMVSANVTSSGGTFDDLGNWSRVNDFRIDIRQEGIFVNAVLNAPKRSIPKNIFPLQAVLANFVDKLAKVYPGNRITLNETTKKGTFTTTTFTITVTNVSPVILSLIGTQLKDLPFVLQNISLTVENGSLSGSITIEALGN